MGVEVESDVGLLTLLDPPPDPAAAAAEVDVAEGVGATDGVEVEAGGEDLDIIATL